MDPTLVRETCQSVLEYLAGDRELGIDRMVEVARAGGSEEEVIAVYRGIRRVARLYREVETVRDISAKEAS